MGNIFSQYGLKINSRGYFDVPKFVEKQQTQLGYIKPCPDSLFQNNELKFVKNDIVDNSTTNSIASRENLLTVENSPKRRENDLVTRSSITIANALLTRPGALSNQQASFRAVVRG